MVSTVYSGSPEVRGFENRSLNRSQKRGAISCWEMRIGSKPVALLWIAVVAMMFVVFLVGFRAGRKQGITTALEEYGEQAVRLPIAQPVALGESSTSSNEARGPVDAAFASTSNLPNNDPSANKPKAALDVETAPVFDFSSTKNLVPPTKNGELANEESSETTAGELAAGFGTRSAEDLVKAESQVKTGNEQKKTNPAAAVIEEPKILQKKPVVAAIAVEPRRNIAEQTLPSGWYVQLAATRSEGEAAELLKRIAHLKLGCITERAKVGTQTFYRVLSGPYLTREIATTVRDRIKSSNTGKGEAFLKFVK